MLTEQNLCVGCYEPITNPLCEECHIKQIKIWLEEQALTRSKKIEIIAVIKRALPKEVMNKNICILCRKHALSIWSYYFFLVSARVLKKLGVRQAILKNFLEIFDNHHNYNKFII